MATEPGEWSWTSGSNQDDERLNGKRGTIEAIEWSEIEKIKNPLRRGMLEYTLQGSQVPDILPVRFRLSTFDLLPVSIAGNI